MTNFGAIPSNIAAKIALASGAVEITGLTTTSATLADITGCTFDVTIPTGRTGTILALMSVQCSAATATAVGAWAISINSVDKQELRQSLQTVGVFRSVSVQGVTTGLSAGTYTVKGRHRRVSGTGTINTGVAQLMALVLLE